MNALGVDQPGGPGDLLVAGVQAAVADVLADRAAEQVRGLEHDAQVALEPVQAAPAVVHAVQQDRPGGGFVEPAQQADDRGLAAAGEADQGDGLAGADGEVEVLQHRLAVLVGKADVLEADLADPVGLAVDRDAFGRVAGGLGGDGRWRPAGSP